MAAASRILHDRYRFFRAALVDERAHDPLAVSFASLELGLSERDASRPHVLQLLHSPPGALGGTEKHVAALLGALADEFDFSVLHPVESGFVLRTMWRRPDGTTAELEFFLPGGARRVEKNHDAEAAAALEMALDWFDFDAVHIQNLIGYSLAPLDVLAHFDGPVVCSVRDLFLACPNHSLLYRNRQACGIPDDLSYCAECLPESRDLELDDLVEFRQTCETRLDTVDTWVFATQSAADYLLRAYDIDPDRIQIITHGAVIPTVRHQPVDDDLVLHEPLRIAFVGRGWSKKGLDTVNHLADQLADTPIEIHHFGEHVEPASPRRPRPRHLRQPVPARPAPPGRHPHRPAPRPLRRDLRPRHDRIAHRRHPRHRRHLRRPRRTHPHPRRRLDHRPRRPRRAPRPHPTPRHRPLRDPPRHPASPPGAARRRWPAAPSAYADIYRGDDRGRDSRRVRERPADPPARREPRVTDDPTAEIERLRRQLRAMSAVTRQLHAQLEALRPDAASRSRGEWARPIVWLPGPRATRPARPDRVYVAAGGASLAARGRASVAA